MRPETAAHADAPRLELSRGRVKRVGGHNIESRRTPAQLDGLHEDVAEAGPVYADARVGNVDANPGHGCSGCKAQRGRAARLDRASRSQHVAVYIDVQSGNR